MNWHGFGVTVMGGFFCFVLKVIECNVEFESETIRIVHWPLMFDVDNVVMI